MLKVPPPTQITSLFPQNGSSSDLANTQDLFQNDILNETALLMDGIKAPNLKYAKARLSTYQNAYVLRLLESLQIDYPVLYAYMGEKRFNQIGRAYIKQHPSVYRSIRWFGANFAYFITVYSKKLCFEAEMAKFEWALVTAFDSADIPLTRETDLMQYPYEAWPYFTFTFHPSVQILTLDWNVIPLWNTWKSKGTFGASPKKHRRSATYIIWRQDLDTYSQKLSLPEANALKAAISGCSLMDIITQIHPFIKTQEPTVYIASLLKRWICMDLIGNIKVLECEDSNML